MSETRTGARELARTYDHYDHALALVPHDTYSVLRRECPVGRSDLYGGFYVLSRHADVHRAYTDPETFSSFPADTPPKPHNRKLIPFEIDPPEHVDYRRMANPLFGPRRMRALEQSLRDHAIALVDDLIERGESDFIRTFALPFPSAAFLNLVGIPAEPVLRDELCRWTNMILHFTGAEQGTDEEKEAVRAEGVAKLWSFVASIIDDRRANLGDDVVSRLLAGTLSGERPLSRYEAISFTYVLVLGGLDTVTAALGFSFWHLGRRPDLRRRLADPALIPGAAEEFLRYESSVHPSRTVLRPCTLSEGVQLSPGDRVVLPIASANRDELVFDRPDEIDFTRDNKVSLAFGAGNHRCIGIHLARLELRVAFEEIFRRIPDFEVPEDAELDAEGGGTRGLTSLPFRILDRAPRPAR
jgi:cytochrome P450